MGSPPWHPTDPGDLGGPEAPRGAGRGTEGDPRRPARSAGGDVAAGALITAWREDQGLLGLRRARASLEVVPDFAVNPAYSPVADQPKARDGLAQGIEDGDRFQTLLGVTGSGKTATMAFAIEQVQRPSLVIAHNKTLAAQLCNEFREFFPNNAVEYFVSYYDYYQPEAYVPAQDLYIEKDSSINQEIERLRHSATASLFGRRDVIVVASVSCIFGLGSPEKYDRLMLMLKRGEMIDRDAVLRKLVDIQYTRNDSVLGRGSFRVRGETLEVFPAYAETAYRAVFFGDEIETLQEFDPLTGEVLKELDYAAVWPATHYATDRDDDRARGGGDPRRARDALQGARGAGQAARVAPAAPAHAVRHGDAARARLLQRDRELLAHPRRPRARRPALLPARLLPGRLRLLHRRVAPDGAADRRHVRGRPLAQADAGGLRLPAAERARQPAPDLRRVPAAHARRSCSCRPPRATSSATTRAAIVEQIVRPTGVVDPEVDVRETKNQIDDLMDEIRKRVEVEERTLVTTLTKKMSEDLTDYLLEYGFKVRYLHSEIDTLERIQIIRELRLGEFDMLVGVNLLREGLDLPEVSLVAILDADKEGFLRGETSLIQTIGRAARNVRGKVIMYADKETAAMRTAISETDRRRAIQVAYNEEHGITPATIQKGISDISDFLMMESKVPERARQAPAAASRRGCPPRRSGARWSSSRRRCWPRPTTCASSTPPSCATRSRRCGASWKRPRPAPEFAGRAQVCS